MKQRNIGIDILKCIAAILIVNSHMDLLYPNKAFATGGGIGDVLFFFCSGFTLFLKPMGRFDNWYKKRINRIYPTVFAWAILGTLFFDLHNDIIYTLLHGGNWFITCIMLYYIILFLIYKLMINRLNLVYAMSSVGVIIWYIILDRPEHYNMYGETYFKWGHYFLFMLLGAIMGISKNELRYRFGYDFLKLIGCIIIYYGVLYASRKFPVAEQLQIISLLPLLGVTFYFYKVANSNILKQIYNHNIWGAVINTIGGLCLEIYLVQFSLFTDKLNKFFPLNIIIIFVYIVIAAYILRCLSRIFSQTFKVQDFDWKAVIKLY